MDEEHPDEGYAVDSDESVTPSMMPRAEMILGAW